jgi:protein disulfide-isomerase
VALFDHSPPCRVISVARSAIFPSKHAGRGGILPSMKTFLAALLLAALMPLQATDLWSTDYEASLKKAAADKRMLLLEFTGSDWCPPCKLQAKEVFDTPGFKEFAEANLVPVKIDFPRDIPQSDEVRAANRALSEKFGVDGFPTLVLLDSKGGELARTVGYDRGGIEGFKAWVESYGK